jgi:hypothetical protein
MTGAGRKKEKAARRQGQQSSKTNAPPETASSENPPSNNDNDGGLDGPRTPEHGFSPSLGYDPARKAAPASQALVGYNRLELPPEAYPVSSVFPCLFCPISNSTYWSEIIEHCSQSLP